MTATLDRAIPNGEADKPVRTAADIMSTPVVTVSVNDSLWQAWSLLYRCGFRHLVVVDGVHVRGLIDDRRITAEWPIGPMGPHHRTVGEVVTRRVRCVLPQTPVRVVARIMLDERTDAVPVVTEHGEIRGLVTTSDLLRDVADRE